MDTLDARRSRRRWYGPICRSIAKQHEVNTMNEKEKSNSLPATEDESIRTVRMTRCQAFNVAEFIEMHLIDAIRNDPDMDNVNWIGDMLDAMRAMQEAAK